jgi:pyruvate/2-oxoglutarate dehydrogenase complex dihydrolipoamide dehydrogenase (E3) component
MQSLRRTVRLRAAPEPSRVKFLMLMNESYDLIVIGSGPAGEKGAAQAAYFDKRVVLVEKDTHLGGAGVNTGAVPSNTLLIATGSVPNWPEGIPRDPRLYDSDSILRMESLPRSLVVVGSGVIGCEYGSMFRAGNGRGQIIGDMSGLVKLVFARGDLKLLGVHILGEMASELVHVGQSCLHFGGTIDDFMQSVYNHPTLGEAYKYAAYDGLQDRARREGS